MYINQCTSTGVFSKYTRCGILKNMLQYTTTGVFSNLKIHPLGYKKTKQLVYHNGCIFRIVMKLLFLRVSATVTSQMRHFPKELLFLRVYATVVSQMSPFCEEKRLHIPFLLCIFLYKLPRVTTGYHRLNTGYHGLPQVTNGYQRLPLSAQLSTRFLMLSNLTNHYIKLSKGDLQCK